MKEKIRIRKGDVNRILLTEVLPYETPIIFSNRNLYDVANRLAQEDVVIPAGLKRVFFPMQEFKQTVPYEYTIRQGANKVRRLSLIHPAHQLKFPNFYHSYDDLILSLCRRSSYSLRYPVRVASYFYQSEFDDASDLQSGLVDETPQEEGGEGRYASSYFYYSKYNQLYKFVDSAEFLDLERRFSTLKRFDIKRCFASIYTHTISWAVKGKKFAKEHRGPGFDKDFDELMMTANFNETNGIVIGPEISRIFAEIILQSVDKQIFDMIEDAGISNSDYALRRYLDDYFLFTRDKNHEAAIFVIAEKALQEFKMYVNEAKTVDLVVPFATSQTIAKADVQGVLNNALLSWLGELRQQVVAFAEGTGSKNAQPKLRAPFLSSIQVIRDIKIAVKRSNQGFDVITGYALAALVKSCHRLQKKIEIHGLDAALLTDLQNLLTATIEVVFFLYSMDFRVRTTYLVSHFVLIIKKLGACDPRLMSYLQVRIKNAVTTVLDSRAAGDIGGVEIQNLLIALRALSPDENYTCGQIRRYMGLDLSGRKIQYFDYIALFYYIGNNEDFSSLKQEIEAILVERFRSTDRTSLQECELSLLLADMLSCPYATLKTKHDIAEIYAKNVLGYSMLMPERNQWINFCTSKLHFVEWSHALQLEKFLVRKQLSPGY